jgi:hypothetical protein
LSNFSSKDRSLGGGSEGRVKLWPHFAQNLKLGELLKLHSGHIFSNLPPHSTQKLATSGFSNWHFGHFIFDALQIYRKVNLTGKRMGVFL